MSDDTVRRDGESDRQAHFEALALCLLSDQASHAQLVQHMQDPDFARFFEAYRAARR